MTKAKLFISSLLIIAASNLFAQSNNSYNNIKNKTMVTTEQKLQLMEIIAGYSLASDKKDVQGHMAYYAEDGFIDGGMKTGTKKTTMAADLKQIFEMEGTLKRHFCLNHQFSKVGDEIHVEYLLLVVEGEQLPGVLATGIIKDVFIQVNGEWKIKQHNINIDPAMFNLMKQWQEQQGNK
jgi:alpha-amylase/alpha-mannosidase (GH57 family)